MCRTRSRGEGPPPCDLREVRMGLLDDVLAQLAPGGTTARDAEGPRSGPGAAGVSSGAGGMQQVMVALLPVVLGMLTSGQRRQPTGLDRGGGGLGDLFGQL